MTSRNLRTYFFHVSSDENFLFEERLHNIFQLPLKNRAHNDARLLFLETALLEDKEYIIGDIERLYMDNIPNKSSITEEPYELDLEDNEGLGYNTAFVYYKEKNILGLQSNTLGITYARFRDYINNCIIECNSSFAINPIIIDDSIATKILQDEVQASFKNIEFTVDNPENYNFLPKDIQASIFKDIAKIGADANAYTLKVTLSASRSKDSFLNKDKVIGALKSIMTSGAAKTLKAKASIGGGDNHDLNFLPNKLQYLGTVQVSKNQASIEERGNAIINAFTYYDNYIRSRGE